MQLGAKSSGQYNVALRVGSRVFAPSWTGTLATLALLPMLVGLGLWQLHRAEVKHALMDQAAAGKQQTLPVAAGTISELKRYQHVSAQGVFDAAHQVLLDNMPSQAGQAGYRVLTPLHTNDGLVLLIDRGWLPLGKTRQDLPDISVDEAPRSVQGLLDELPAPGIRLGQTSPPGEAWPKLLNFPRYEDLLALYGKSLAPRIVLLDADQAGGYERHWQIDVGFGPERHIGYAVQWFGLALALLVIYFVVNLKRSAKFSGNPVEKP